MDPAALAASLNKNKQKRSQPKKKTPASAIVEVGSLSTEVVKKAIELVEMFVAVRPDQRRGQNVPQKCREKWDDELEDASKPKLPGNDDEMYFKLMQIALNGSMKSTETTFGVMKVQFKPIRKPDSTIHRWQMCCKQKCTEFTDVWGSESASWKKSAKASTRNKRKAKPSTKTSDKTQATLPNGLPRVAGTKNKKKAARDQSKPVATNNTLNMTLMPALAVSSQKSTMGVKEVTRMEVDE